ncbi:tRNA (adenosine(37)-N6)-threonylcarbamoyltransferase complex dimerization subunit type 1 TsaB [Thalassotalea euphylliae]|uniref:tRNA threonylcarbamoyladenosine biosynthesis protein TsaB n=1 Tax=Thalassotalea euphylliae TaxID=1655234 RepID=A0A3E0UE79_9GAMM|nr:tRNA (adenosine(37)-N6)-threonylcarbamoyltransferase complex dimerization subunit type 1 TsaB [Thalassotalea euphylliae]
MKVNLLAIDASTEACSVAILKDDQVFSDFELCPQSHSVVLLPMVDKLLAKAGAKLTDFDALVYGRGPGSFTGVRIGIGVAQGLAFAADLPTIGISTMQAMAQQAYEQEGKDTVSVAIDARMAEVYCSNWQVNEQGLMALVGEERVLPPEQFAQSLEQGEYKYGAGTGWQAYQEAFQSICANLEKISVMYPNAQYMLALAKQEFITGKALPAEHAQPVYVRDTVSWKKLPGRE